MDTIHLIKKHKLILKVLERIEYCRIQRQGMLLNADCIAMNRKWYISVANDYSKQINVNKKRYIKLIQSL